jgi:hypothetical protein
MYSSSNKNNLKTLYSNKVVPVKTQKTLKKQISLAKKKESVNIFFSTDNFQPNAPLNFFNAKNAINF